MADFLVLTIAFDALEKVQNTAPAGSYLDDARVAKAFDPSPEGYDTMTYEHTRGNYNTKDEDVLSVGLGSSDIDFGIAMGGNYDLKGYEKIYDTFATALFEGKASDFKKAFEAKLAERKKSGTFKPVTLTLNSREVRIDNARL